MPGAALVAVMVKDIVQMQAEVSMRRSGHYTGVEQLVEKRNGV